MTILRLFLAGLLSYGVWYVLSGNAYRDAYRRAAWRDIAYVRDHPDCDFYAAHRHRDRIDRLFLKH